MNKIEEEIIPKEYARVLIKNEKNEILLIHQKYSKGDYWTFPGGKLEDNETPEMGAVRETWEEIGVKVDKMEFLCQNDVWVENIFWRGYFFYAHEISGHPLLKEKDKALEVSYVSMEKLPELNAIQELLSGIAFRPEVRENSPTKTNT